MAVRLTRVERKARTREEILEAAHRVFLRDGFHRATLDDIAEEAGYTTGAVYSNFDGKDGLFLALLDQQFAVRLAPHVERFNAARSLDEGLRASASVLAETARREPLWAPLLVEFWTACVARPPSPGRGSLASRSRPRRDGRSPYRHRRAVRGRLVTSGA